MASSLDPFFKASGVAILGASTHSKKLSYGIVENLLTYGYKGGIYPVNPNASEILGLKVYPSVMDVPDPVELAVIVLPSAVILDTLEACGQRGIKAVVIITGGFKEVGESGAKLEEAGLAIAKRYGMRIIGPNCVGTMDLNSGVNTTFIKGMPVAGPIGFISQSGAVCGGVVDLIVDTNIGFSHFASLGNEMDVSETDMIEYMENDPNVKVIAMYIEGIMNGPRFMQVARRVTRKKPIVFLKAGRNEAGTKAVSSHTGSLAGSYASYQAALSQAGVIEVDTIAELFNVSWALGTQPLPKGNRVAITTNAGGAAALAADSIDRGGFQLASIPAEIQSQLRTKLNPAAQVSNPVDMLGSVSPEDYLWSLSNLAIAGTVDVLIPILVPQALVDIRGVAEAWVEIGEQAHKTLLTCLMGYHSTAEAVKLLNQNGVPVYAYPDQIGPVLKAMNNYRMTLEKFAAETDLCEEMPDTILDTLTIGSGNRIALGEYETRQLLEAYGIDNVPGGLAKTEEESVSIANQVGYPVVIKIVAKSILHKSDAGGIKLNLINEDKLRVAYRELIDSISQNYPETEITGVMVEKMAAKGLEVIVGMKRDVTFGPMIMFGMGGTMVELVKDVALKVAPMTDQDIDDMIDRTLAGKLLRGFRGSEPADIMVVKDIVRKLSCLAFQHPEVKEIEINPLIVYPESEGAISLDSRMILSD
ncbi:MAG: acetate--CoA ligase family protein [Anaerolineaceae bacterium]